MRSTFRFPIVPKLQDIFFISIFISVLMFGQRMLNLDGDLPRHLLMGKYILENHTIPTVELFIHPYLNRPYVPHEWLVDAIQYIIFHYVDLTGIILVSAFLLATTFLLLYKHLSNKLDLHLPVLILVAWGAGVTSINWGARPHLFSMFMLVVWLIWADQLRSGRKTALWRLPIFMIVWSNLHGEFIAGILVLVAYSFGWLVDYVFDRSNADPQIGKNLWLALLLSTIASFLNPNGIGPWISILGFINNEYLMSRMVESNAPSFQNPDLTVFFGLLLFSIFLLSLKKGGLATGQAFLLAGFSAMGLIAIRNVHLYGIVAPFVLSETLDEFKKLPALSRIEQSIKNMETQLTGGAIWSVVFAIGASIFIIFNRQATSLYQFQKQTFPVDAVQWLKVNPLQGNMFNELNWGGYIELHLWPENLTFIDSVADVTGEVTMEYEKVSTLQSDWKLILEQYNVSWMIIRSDSPLKIKTQWDIVYEDTTAVILQKP